MMPKIPLRDVFVEFGGDPSDDKEVYKRYCATKPFKPALLSAEVVQFREVRFVQMKDLRTLVKERLINITHSSDDGEYIHFKILPDGPEIGQWLPRGPQMVVNCRTVHENFPNSFPQLFDEVKT